LKKVKKFLKGWGYNRAGKGKQKKKKILEELEVIEQSEEIALLDNQTIGRRCTLMAEMLHILEEEELFWFKRSHKTWLLQGDNNTEFFHRVVNGRKHRQTIYSLEDGLDHITGDDNLLRHATSYYKNLFSQGSGNSFHLDPSLCPLEDMVTSSENDELVRPFSMEKIQVALFQVEKNKTTWHDGFPMEFFQVLLGVHQTGHNGSF
jgi:hypothetical protein